LATENSYGELGSFAARLIKRKAAQLVGRAGLTATDRKDVEQELSLDVLRRMPKFDPERGSFEAFVLRVVDNCVATILAARKAAIRDYRRCRQSLSKSIEDGEGGRVERAQTFDAEQYMRRSASRSEEELRDLRLDLAEAEKALPPELRELSERLRRETPTEIARVTGVPRSTVYEAIARIRKRFRRHGLDQY